MKVLIYGHRGWIGSQFLDILKQDTTEVEIVCGESRVDNDHDVEHEIQKVKPTHVISFIGRTHGVIGDKKYPTIDYLEQPGKLVDNIRDNMYSPLLLSILSQKYNFHFTYLGTGCIFEYDSSHHQPLVEEEDGQSGKLVSPPTDGFTENDKPNFDGSSYSIVKGFTDRMVHHLPILNLRIRMPITDSKNSRNFITKITTYQKICSLPNSMSVLPTLLPLVFTMMKDRVVGTINLVNPGVITHNRILNLYREYVDSTHTWENFSIQEQDKVLDARRSNNYLTTTRLEELFPDVPSIEEAVKSSLQKYSIE